MYNSKSSILLVCMTVSISKSFDSISDTGWCHLRLVLLWCTVQPINADTNEEEHQLVETIDDDTSADDLFELYRRASLRPVVLQQRASLRPFAGKRASLRPFAGKRASLRPFAGKRASLRPASYMGSRKRRDVLFYEQ